LRHYRLDELPQLVNVLLGHMNIVGPRPEQPGIFHELRKEFDRYPNRQQVLPGITGWAQVNHGYDQSIKDVQRKLELDLEYLDRRSTVEDFKIMARTVPVMVFKQGSV
jgi:lipopolysaccharide/colanic/teichoic acid biosynthesis glycosyltransferase